MKPSNLAWRVEAGEPDTTLPTPDAPAPEESWAAGRAWRTVTGRDWITAPS